MKVAKDRFVRCEYELRVAGGEVLESSSKSGPIEYKHGTGKMLPALEKQLEGMEVGQEKKGIISAVDAFGTEDSAPALAVPRSLFPKEATLQVGALFEAKDPHGKPLKLKIASIDGDNVTARAVHPLAGKDLEFRVKVLALRDPPPPVPSRPPPEEVKEDDLVEEP
jgi:FKBP-type peptidyl-prolyl cis-trans isomerase 2